jgi:hypothetical protein
MPDNGTAKQAMAYVDQLNHEVAALAACIDQQMARQGYLPSEEAGDTVYWYLNPSYKQPAGWRLQRVTRLFLKKSSDTTQLYASSAFYAVILEPETPLPFLPVLCARIEHREPLTPYDAHSKVHNSIRLKSLCFEHPAWQHFGEEQGWYLASPAAKLPIRRVRGYILNLYDLISVEAVGQNIIAPLTADEPLKPLKEYLTIEAHAFPAYAAQRDGR